MAGNTTQIPAANGAASAQQIADPGNPLAALLPLLTQQNTKVTGGTGDVAALQQLFAQLMPQTSVAGMSPIIQAIFNEGFQKQMPQLYNASNQAGMRPGSATQQQLLINDLNARLTAEAAKAVSEQQRTAAQVAGSIAQNSKTPQQTVQKTQVNPTNAALAALVLGGAKVLSSVMAGDKGTATSSAGDVFNTKKRNATDYVTSVLDMLYGNTPQVGMALPDFSTGGINPNAMAQSTAVSNTSPFNGGGYGTNNAVMDFINGFQQGGVDQGASQVATMYAMSQIPVIGPYMAAANAAGSALGINEIGQTTGSITNLVGDVGSGLWNAASDVGTSITKAVGCYITTAICELSGKPDDCEELQTLRSFRDNWLEKQPGGKEIILQYYEQAPKFLFAINSSTYRDQLLQHFNDVHIKPAVAAVKRGDNEAAFSHYVAMLADANTYIKHLGV